MNTYNVKEIEDFSFFNNDVYIDDKFLLAIPELNITSDLKFIVLNWNFEFVLSDGDLVIDKNHKNILKNDDSAKNNVVIIDNDKSVDVDQNDDKNDKYRELISSVEETYKKFLHSIQKIYDLFSQGVGLHVRIISDTAKEICDFVNSKQKLILQISADRFSDIYDYLVIHALRSTVFSIIIGSHLGEPSYKLIELAISSLIHEIGMLKIPPQIYMSPRALRIDEQQTILTHPILSYHAAKDASFSLPICLGCLEHHERENGGGYPRRLPGSRISLYGKIIAVACAFEGATGKRPYKVAKTPSAALIEIIKNEHKQFDEKVLKALLFSLSFYPIGEYVVLSNNQIARVVDVNPDDPRFPIVQIYDGASQNSSPKVFGTSKTGIYILRAIKSTELPKVVNQ